MSSSQRVFSRILRLDLSFFVGTSCVYVQHLTKRPPFQAKLCFASAPPEDRAVVLLAHSPSQSSFRLRGAHFAESSANDLLLHLTFLWHQFGIFVFSSAVWSLALILPLRQLFGIPFFDGHCDGDAQLLP